MLRESSFFRITLMKKISVAVAITLASLGTVHAQDMSNAQYGVPAQAQPTYVEVKQSKMRFFIGMGLTGGGDEIASVYYDDGDEGDVTFGSLVQLGGGVDYRINSDLSLQASFHTHVSSQGADNGSVRFTRLPMELIGYYNVSPQWRVGVGARYVSNARIRSRGAAANIGNFDIDNTVGGLVEAEYLVSSRVGVKLRYVSEKYEVSGLRGKLDGSHVGVFGNFYF